MIALFIIPIIAIPVLLYIFHPAIKVMSRNNFDVGVKDENLTNDDTTDETSSSSSSSHIKETKQHILSIIIPAYNEEERLPPMLQETYTYLTRNRESIAKFCESALPAETTMTTKTATFEIIVVDDGSSDNTGNKTRQFANEAVSSSSPSSTNVGDTIRLLTLQKNSGKGAAVRAGMIRSNGDLCLMVDADGATDFGHGLPKVLKELSNLTQTKNNDTITKPLRMAAVFGSRAHMEQESKAVRSAVRTFLMNAFHFFVKNLCSSKIRDTQCGFKVFTKSAAIALFTNLHLTRWAFDTELVVMAEMLQMPISEVGVVWHEVDGSKLDTNKITLALVSLGMLRDMICVRACYTLGLWRLRR